MKKISGSRIAAGMIFLLMTIFNVAAWVFPTLMELYHSTVYHFMSGALSRICGIFPFSVGEILIALAILLVTGSIVTVVIAVIKKDPAPAKAVTRVLTVVLAYIYATETLNCFVLYHTIPLTERLAPYTREEYTVEELVELCRYMILEANDLALTVKRDEQGNIILPERLDKCAEDAFANLKSDFPELSGYCPRPKRMIASTLMTQLDLQGVYFPFTLEGNYNGYLSPARTPTTVFHEITHIKGFIREDEATFLACIAALSSDVPEVRYSGCIESMNYLFAECRKYATEEQIYSLRCDLSIRVAKDNYFVSEEHMKKAETSVLPKETVNKVGEKAMETTLKVNGVNDGKKSYNRMVTLLLIWAYRTEDRPAIRSYPTQ